ncbi:MAG: hypothetical protein QNI89_17905 [Desulfobacterales bacterium]|nr:hypothetical protein [Desulfobacterales bacterium]MDJ0889183.1 hypothetical protein [Desulfobacterales bacterium]MDJ0989909.1 hypothetical protein [Desulfobacterales bacterium]
MSEKFPKLAVTVAHTLPGRLRLALSHPPRRPRQTERIVSGHAGINSAVYSKHTTNLLVRYDPEAIALEEIILRTALCLSADYQLHPIMIKTSSVRTSLSALSLFSGLSLLAAHTLVLLSGKNKSLSALQVICGLGTTAAVSEHIYLDLKEKGRFHPEVLSIGYLFSSFLRGNVLKGATTAWMMTFARHLLEPPNKVLKLEAKAMEPACDAQQCEYEAKISREVATRKGAMGMVSQLPHLLLGMYTDMQLTAEDRIFKEIQKLSQDHHDVLEGLEQLKHGIRLRVGA